MNRRKYVIMSVVLVLILAATGVTAYRLQKNKKSVSEVVAERSSVAVTEKNRETGSGDAVSSEALSDEKTETSDDGCGDNIIMLGAVKMELLSADVIDGSDLSGETKYPLEYFVTQTLPDPDITITETDWDAIYIEAPELKEVRQADFGVYSRDEILAAMDKYQDVIDKYTYKETYTSTMYFIKCRLTNTGDSKVGGYLPYDTVDWLPDTGDLDYSESVWYFDKPIYTEGEERDKKYFYYELDKDESMECTIGIRFAENVFGENELHYYGIIPEGNDDPTFDPSVIPNLVNMNDIPKTKD